jgi:hypothetical protein
LRLTPRTLFGALLVPIALVGASITARRGATRVIAVLAGGGDVPSNLLRVYIEFSAPMEPGTAYEHIHLVDDSGRVQRDAFLELREELWSPNHRRLTLLFDPGRLKRGIRANLEMGPPLEAGRTYRLVIDSAWRDARNHALSSTYTQELRVAGFDSISPNPGRWTLSSPRAGTHDSLVVRFDESLDHALAARLITVVDGVGSRLAGHSALDAADRTWTFVPVSAWPRSASLRVSPALEDLAGNNLVRRFDTSHEHGGDTLEAAVTDTAIRLIPIGFSDSGQCAPPAACTTPRRQ